MDMDAEIKYMQMEHEQWKKIAYYLYLNGMKSKWIECVPYEEFGTINDYDMYMRTAVMLYVHGNEINGIDFIDDPTLNLK